MNIHELKIEEQYFEDVAKGVKKAELRLNDRTYKTGDMLILKEWNPLIERHTDRVTTAIITHVYEGPFLPNGYAMLSIRILK